MTRRILSGLAVSSVALVANAEPTLLTNIPPKNTPVDHLLDEVDIAGGDISARSGTCSGRRTAMATRRLPRRTCTATISMK